MAYDKRLETNRLAMQAHNDAQKAAAAARLKTVAAKKKAKRQAKKEAQA